MLSGRINIFCIQNNLFLLPVLSDHTKEHKTQRWNPSFKIPMDGQIIEEEKNVLRVSLWTSPKDFSLKGKNSSIYYACIIWHLQECLGGNLEAPASNQTVCNFQFSTYSIFLSLHWCWKIGKATRNPISHQFLKKINKAKMHYTWYFDFHSQVTLGVFIWFYYIYYYYIYPFLTQ